MRSVDAMEQQRVVLDGEPTRRDGEPSMVYRGRLLYWHLNPDAPPYDGLDVTTRSRWTMLASGMDGIMARAPRDADDPVLRRGFSRHEGGPGVVGPVTFNTAQ